MKSVVSRVARLDARAGRTPPGNALGQPLTGRKFIVARLRRMLGAAERPPARADIAQELDDAAAIIAGTITTVKDLATKLRPRVLDTLGLAAAVEWQCQEFELRTGVACECRLPIREVPLGPEKSTAFFRILQESLTNVARLPPDGPARAGGGEEAT